MRARSDSRRTVAGRDLLWRLHFWAALIAGPFVLLACLTGLLYVFTPQVERLLHGRLDSVEPAGRPRPLDESVTAARRAAPAGTILHSVMPAAGPRDSLRVAFVAAEGGGGGGDRKSTRLNSSH